MIGKCSLFEVKGQSPFTWCQNCSTELFCKKTIFLRYKTPLTVSWTRRTMPLLQSHCYSFYRRTSLLDVYSCQFLSSCRCPFVLAGRGFYRTNSLSRVRVYRLKNLDTWHHVCFWCCQIQENMVHTDLRPFFSRTFQGQIIFFQGLVFLSIFTYMWSTPQFKWLFVEHVEVPAFTHFFLFQLEHVEVPTLKPKPKDNCVTGCSHRLFCLCFSLLECDFSALSPILETSIIRSHCLHNAFCLSTFNALT